MDHINTTPGFLEFVSCPAFTVQRGFVIYVNSTAKALTVTPGIPVESLLMDGKEEYESMESGCLCLTVSICGQRFNASVSKMNGQDVFLLDQQETEPIQQALAKASVTFRNSLNLVMSSIKALQQDPDSLGPEGENYLRKLTKAAHQMLLQVSNMSHAAAFANDPPPSLLVNVEQVFREIVEKAAVLLGRKGIHVRYNGLNKPVLVPADSQKLERAVYNLILNSAQSFDAGGNIDVSLVQGKGKLYLTVEDDGRGIPDEILPTLFYRYRQSPAVGSAPSIGLGLPLARAVAAAHGGIILVERRRPKGTRVTMTLAQPKQGNDSTLRSPALSFDYFGGHDHALVELSQILPDDLYKE